MASTAIASNFPQISGYRITEQIYNGEKTAVYRAIKESTSQNCSSLDCELPDGEQSVVIKVLQQHYLTFNNLVHFRNQYSITSDLSIPGIIRPLSLEPWQQGYALVTEDFGGISLQQYTRQLSQEKNSLALVDVLAIATQLATILHDLAQHQIVHKDIKPANILIQPESKRIELIDFSIASQLPKETQALQNPNGLEGTLAYLAPEQTGRMNRGIDYRTDFYSLGVTLYELLTGELPFQSNEPLALVHCHIAKTPKAPHQLNPDIPPQVSAIVLKLMAKNAENRYQSALGLQHDLDQCLTQWKETGEILPFELGERDLSDRFIISEKLYGREAEVQALLNAFDRVAARSHHTLSSQVLSSQSAPGHTEMLLVAGSSGIGKTAIINEVHKPITRQQGYFIKGKFDQLNRNLPLSAFLQAIQDLIGQLLAESDAKLAHWRSQILEALGEDAQVLIDVIPALENIIGLQPRVPDLAGAAAQHRFNRLLQAFLTVFSSPKHPLVIFIDDLQWADSASLEVITQLMAEQKHLLFLGAYRDHEVSPAHPFMLTVEAIQKDNGTVNTLTLAPLTERDTNRLVADTLHCSVQRAAPLTDSIRRKTEGNPFFTTQFLKLLYEEGHISFNQRDCAWEADLIQINALACTDDVVDFMAAQLQKLPERTQKVFQLAACIGNQFDLETLAIAADQSCTQTAEALWEGLHEGLIIPQSDVYKFYLGEEAGDRDAAPAATNITYRFLHDRVQQAAYTLISEDQRQLTHLKIGQRLLAQTDAATSEENGEHLFEMVNHLNIGVALITQPAQRHQLSQLNLQAAQKAKAATAYETAMQYLTAGIDLLPVDGWESQYDLALALHEAAAEMAILCGEFEQMECWAEAVLQQATTPGDRVNVYDIKIQAHASRYQFAEAISLGIEALAHFDVSLPTSPTPQDIQQSFGETIALLASKGFDLQKNNGENILTLADLPPMTDAHQLAIIQLTATLVPAAFLGMPMLFPLLVLIQMKSTVNYGNSPQAPYTYGSYSFLLSAILNDIKASERFGQLTLDLAFTHPSKDVQARAYLVVGLSHHHTHSFKAVLAILQKGYQTALDSGNLEYVGYAVFHSCYDLYFMGRELVELEKSISAYTQVLAEHHQLATLNYCNICHQAVLNLLGSPQPETAPEENTATTKEQLTEDQHPTCLNPHQLIGAVFNEDSALPQLLAINDMTGLINLYTHKLMLSYLLEEILLEDRSQISSQSPSQTSSVALEIAHQARQYLPGGAGFAITPVFYFYDALTALRYLADEPNQRAQQLQQVEENQAKLKHWAEHAPMNYLHKFELVEAERYRIAGNKAEAIEHYEQVIAQAKAQGFIQEAALANELAAKFYLEWEKEKLAAIYLQEAYYGYARWGAKAKIQQLEQCYPRLLAALAQPDLMGTLPFQSITSSSTLTPATLAATLAATLVPATFMPATLDRLGDTSIRTTGRTIGGTMRETLQPLSHSATTVATATTSQSLWLDFAAITQAGQAISQEIELEKLLTTLMQIVIANAGAQLGYFILHQDEQWVIRAQSDAHEVMAIELPMEASSRLPHSLIYSVARTQKAAVFENLSTSGQFESDRYISLHRPTSALCMPISRQGQIAGILYLENNLTEGAFTEDRIETLQILTSQAAISIENARLYQQTERYSQSLEVEVAQKTEALNQKVTALKSALTKLKKTQAQLIQTEKMSSLGQLVAGVAHEINNPINFIHTNIKHLGNYNQDLLELVKGYKDAGIQPPDTVKELLEEIDLDFVIEDSEQLVTSVNKGSDRIKQIVLSLRNFSRLDEAEIKQVNVHEGIDSTLTILQHRLKATPLRPEIAIELNYGDLPQVECHPGQLNQVLMNLFNNAIDALSGREIPPQNIVLALSNAHLIDDKIIRIWTEAISSDRIAIHIADNGIGIPKEMRSRIFDPFFTTKPVGEGPGLGLTTSYQIITEIHGGQLYYAPTPEPGTEMVIELPTTLKTVPSKKSGQQQE